MDPVAPEDYGQDIDPETGNFVTPENESGLIDEQIKFLEEDLNRKIEEGADNPDNEEYPSFCEIKNELDELQNAFSENPQLARAVYQKFHETLSYFSDLGAISPGNPNITEQSIAQAINLFKQTLPLLNYANSKQAAEFIDELYYFAVTANLPRHIQREIEGAVLDSAKELVDHLMQSDQYPLAELEIIRQIHLNCFRWRTAKDLDNHLKLSVALDDVAEQVWAKFRDSFHYPINDETVKLQACFFIDLLGGSIAREYEQSVVDRFASGDTASRDSLASRYDLRLLSSLVDSGSQVINNVVKEYMLGLGLDWDRLLKSWQTIRQDYSRTEHIYANLRAIDMLEGVDKGMCSRLNSQYGIEFFGRYPAEVLVRQDAIRDQDTPYGVMLYPKADWNSALQTQPEIIGSLYSQLKALGYGLRIVEARGKYSAGRRLSRLNKKYGSKNKITFIVIAAHGSRNTMEFGPARRIQDYVQDPSNVAQTRKEFNNQLEDYRVTKADLEKNWAQRLKAFFEDGFSAIFLSCSVGASGGIAESANRQIGAESIAPTNDSRPMSIKVSKVGDQLAFDVDYEHSETNYIGRIN